MTNETKQKKKTGRPRRDKPQIRTGLSMKHEDGELVLAVLKHATDAGKIPAPPSRLSGQPFAGVVSLLVMFCSSYAAEHGLDASV